MQNAAAKRPGIGFNTLMLFCFLAVTLAIGFAGGQVTAPNIPAWYQGLAKPSFSPPNGVFMPVWTTLYILMAVAAWLVWRKEGFRSRAMGLWVIQLALNFAWSVIFFGLHAPFAAVVELIVLWLAILATIVAFSRSEQLAAWLLAPYLAWVSFAGVLNFWVWRLNP